MGAPIASKLAQSALSSQVIVFDSNPEAMASTRKNPPHKIILAEASKDVFKHADVIFMCLPTTKHVRSVLLDECGGGLLPGSCVVDLTSGEPKASSLLAEELAEKGVHYLDMPVSGGSTLRAGGKVAG